MKTFIFSVLWLICLCILITGCASFSLSHPASKTEKETISASEPVKTCSSGTSHKRKNIPVKNPILPSSEADKVSITIIKSERTLYLYNGDDIIASYSVGIGKKEGAKEKEGDKKTPEGKYYVCTRNEYSKFHLALGLSYPNTEDAERGYQENLITQAERNKIEQQITAGEQPDWNTSLGGQIMIHGQKGDLGGQCDWSTGCVTVDNEVIDILWNYCPIGTSVTILP